jgi:hypothetical protein
VGSAQHIARRHFDAWTSGDSSTVAALLSPTFRFAAGDLTIDGRGDRSVRVVEQLTVRDGTIASSVFVTDMAAFAAFAGLGGPGADGRP